MAAPIKYHIEVGDRFGKWVVLEQTTIRKNNTNYRAFVCRCDCGTVSTIIGAYLGSGETTQCQNCRIAACTEIIKNYPCSNYIDGRSKTRIYSIWKAMINRCTNPADSSYSRYGGRGITVCTEWLNDYKAFEQWSLENNYDSNLQIDRIDNSKGYSPSNCRWVSIKVNANNKSNNVRLEYNGQIHTLREWSELLNIPYHVIQTRRRAGWPVERILTTPVEQQKKYHTINGVTKHQGEWCREYGVNPSMVSSRLKRGWDFERALLTPSRNSQSHCPYHPRQTHSNESDGQSQ